MNTEEPLSQIILKASEMGTNEIEIEYKDGYEEIIIRKDQLGFGIDRLKSNSKEAIKLRKQIYDLKKRKRIQIADEKYKIQIKIYDSFGEDAFRIWFQKI
jgi:hypothetical protein